MADIRSIDVRIDEIIVNLKISDDEYALLNQETKDLILVPTAGENLDERLTTGKLGNSKRVMLPKKILSKYNVKNLPKKAKSKIFNVGDNVFLLIQLKEDHSGIPEFKEDL